MSQIIEIGFEIESEEKWEILEAILDAVGIPYYIEPKPAIPWNSLEDLECQCEGK